MPSRPARLNKYGLLPLTVDQGSHRGNGGHNENPVDIIAIHGLDGDAYRTFTAENGTLWLSDFLPAEFPGARVFSYGYPSEVPFPFGTGNLDTFARALLEGIRNVRARPEYRRRRIIFICHSMGGLVLKKAMNLCVVEPDQYNDIRSSLHSIFFMGTPHRGSNVADLTAVLANVSNTTLAGTSRLTGGIRSDLVKSLKRGSEELIAIASDFRKQTNNVRIVSFIEEKNTAPFKHRIVDDESARVGVASEALVSMKGYDHKSICRFGKTTDHGYLLVLGRLREAVKQATLL